jgi:hypothetical protein
MGMGVDHKGQEGILGADKIVLCMVVTDSIILIKTH